jgi:hypothetical protein
MGRLRPHLNTIPLIVRSRGAKNPQISVLFAVPLPSSPLLWPSSEPSLQANRRPGRRPKAARERNRERWARLSAGAMGNSLALQRLELIGVDPQ